MARRKYSPGQINAAIEKFHIHMDSLLVGDYMLFHGDSWVSRRIQENDKVLVDPENNVWQNAWANHIGVYMGRLYVIEAMWPRSRISDIEKKYLRKGQLDIRWIRRIGQTNEERYRRALWAASLCNLRYDTKSLLWFKIPFHIIPWNWLSSKRAMICSELATIPLYKEADYVFGMDEKIISQIRPVHYEWACQNDRDHCTGNYQEGTQKAFEVVFQLP